MSVGIEALTTQVIGPGRLPLLRELVLNGNERIGDRGIECLIGGGVVGGVMRELRQLEVRTVGMSIKGAMMLLTALNGSNSCSSSSSSSSSSPCPHLEEVVLGGFTLPGDGGDVDYYVMKMMEMVRGWTGRVHVLFEADDDDDDDEEMNYYL